MLAFSRKTHPVKNKNGGNSAVEHDKKRSVELQTELGLGTGSNPATDRYSLVPFKQGTEAHLLLADNLRDVVFS